VLLNGGRSLSRGCLGGLGMGWGLVDNRSRRRYTLVGVIDRRLLLGGCGIRGREDRACRGRRRMLESDGNIYVDGARGGSR
jgi:hypothetical protein